MSQPQPAHLGPQYAAQFQDVAVACAYPARPPYPAEVFDRLRALLVEPRRILDIGCGTGDLARRLAPLAQRVDAVDASPRMIAVGRALPGGDHLTLRWLNSPIEDAPLGPPDHVYGLIVAGESLHWMPWGQTLPRLRDALAPNARLVIVEREEQPSPWSDALLSLTVRYSTNREFRPYRLVDELEGRSLFALEGEAMTAAEPCVQTLDAYIESIHSRNGFSRDRMPPADAEAFDAALRAIAAPHARNGALTIHTRASLWWGQPLAPGHAVRG